MFGFVKRYSKPGGVPGTLTVPAKPRTDRVTIRVTHYGPDHVVEEEVPSVDAVAAFLERPGTTWIDVVGVHDVDILRRFGEHFDLHALALEDVVNLGQRPKLEEYGDHFFLVLKLFHLDPEDSILDEQIGIFWGSGHVLTFQEIPGDVFDPIRERIRSGGGGRIRKAGADYLTYALVDALVDNFFPVLEKIGDRLEELEERLLEHPTHECFEEIHRVKRELMLIRRGAWPQREVVSSLERLETKLLKKETRVFLRDCYDHAVQIIDVIESYRDLAGSLTELYLSYSSHRTNETMKVLTVMASIFIPLTFVAGIYGMNFDPEASPWNMPELRWAWGYPAFWTVIIVLAVGMVVVFRRKGWLD